MRTILKYTLETVGTQWIKMPVGAKLLSAQTQRGDICVWALVDLDAAEVRREFHFYGTGHPYLDGALFVATVQDGPLVWHIFDGGEQ